MNKYLKEAILGFVTLGLVSVVYGQVPVAPDEIFNAMEKVANWQIKDIEENGWHWPTTDWTNAAYYAGQFEWAKLSDDPKQMNFLVSIGNKNQWQGGPDQRFFADDYAVGQTYANLFELYRDSAMIRPMIRLADEILAQPHTEPLLWNFAGGLHNREWAWSDALFMGPPTLSYIYKVTGDRKYLDGMNRLWWRSHDYLYDPEEHLYFRDSRFFDRREKNGKKVFWSRGNGWVIAGLARILDNMPADYPTRPRYVKIFKEMSQKIARLQLKDGFWRTSLLDPKSFPSKETSGTAFFAYGLAWGVNRGYLSYDEYFPVIKKAWDALNSSVHKNGKLGYVQVPGSAPENVKFDDSETYGVGAYLLTGTELFKMMFDRANTTDKIVVTNPASLDRRDDMIELKWHSFSEAGFEPSKITVIDARTNKEVPSQVVYHGEEVPQSLIFQSGIASGGNGYFYFRKQVPSEYEPKVFGRHVPERYDDFAWENDKIGYRMYGAALDKQPDNAKGLDVWAKKTSGLIINEWYKKNDYHVDHGEGLDAYGVGFTLGAGNSAPIFKDSLVFPANYADYKILDNGPLRLTFQLIYKPWKVNDQTVELVKTITIDAGSNLNKIEDNYKFSGRNLMIAAGLTKHENDGVALIDKKNKVMSYWDQSAGKVDNGKIGVGLIVPQKEKAKLMDRLNHLLAVVDLREGRKFVYYQGSGWNKSGFFPYENSWREYLLNFSRKLRTPLEVVSY